MASQRSSLELFTLKELAILGNAYKSPKKKLKKKIIPRGICTFSNLLGNHYKSYVFENNILHFVAHKACLQMQSTASTAADLVVGLETDVRIDKQVHSLSCSINHTQEKQTQHLTWNFLPVSYGLCCSTIHWTRSKVAAMPMKGAQVNTLLQAFFSYTINHIKCYLNQPCVVLITQISENALRALP